MTIESITCTCSQYPNQFEGVVDGKCFYFRARRDHWTLQVNEHGGDGLDGRLVAEGCGADEPGGEWEPEDAERFVRKQLDAYSGGKCAHCEGTGRSRHAQCNEGEK